MQDLAENIQHVKQQIQAAAESIGKSLDDITLVGVTKTVVVERINEALRLGLHHIGENRIQEARQKLPQVDSSATFHMIGHLQRNKVKYAVKLFNIIQSIDTISLAEEINARCAKCGKQMPVLIEVNTSGESSKFGCDPRAALTLLKALDRLPNLTVKGFMTIALYSEDPEKVRPCFQVLRQIYEESREMALVNAEIDTLSMGMSSDFEVAIEEGANMVRIGSAIFGERPL